MTIIYQTHLSNQPTSTQCHLQLKPPSTPQIIKIQQYLYLLSTLKWRQVELPLHRVVCIWLTVSDTPPAATDFDDDTEKADFLAAPLMTWYGLRNPYQADNYAFIWLQITQQWVMFPRNPYLQNGNLWITQVVMYPTSLASLRKYSSQIMHHLGFEVYWNITN